MSSSSDSDWLDITDDRCVDEESMNKSPCLFCDVMFSVADECLEHLINNHNFNLKAVIRNENMNFYKYIKYINYVRLNFKHVNSIENIKCEDYNDDKWLIPVIDSDLMLQIDVESISGEAFIPLDFTDKIAIVEERAKLAEEFLERALDDLNKCRKDMSDMLLGNASKSHKIEEEENDNGYFGSYAHFGIHEEMLKDRIRTDAYQTFILYNPNIFRNSTILDVGCGTSVLSMFSAKAGAKKVYAVDYSEIAYKAMDIIRENKLEKVVEVIKGKAEDIDLKVKVDVIISEWMGYFLLFESMLDTVIFCRDNYLSADGCVYPDKCNIQLAALADSNLYESKVGYWDNVYGFKMTTMKCSVIEEPLIQIVDPNKVISESCILKSFDLMKITVSELDFDAKFQLKITKDGLISAVVCYFDIFFERNASTEVSFSTSPASVPTHWKQTVFFLKNPIEMKAGCVLYGQIFCKKNKKDHRALDITLTLFDDKDQVKSSQHYVLA